MTNSPNDSFSSLVLYFPALVSFVPSLLSYFLPIIPISFVLTSLSPASRLLPILFRDCTRSSAISTVPQFAVAIRQGVLPNLPRCFRSDTLHRNLPDRVFNVTLILATVAPGPRPVNCSLTPTSIRPPSSSWFNFCEDVPADSLPLSYVPAEQSLLSD